MIGTLVFGAAVALTILSALVVSFSKSIVYSGLSLLGAFFGIAILYVLLSADFVAITQVLIYVGGVLILVLFAIMLTEQIDASGFTNLSINRAIAGVLSFLLFVFLGMHLWQADWVTQAEPSFQSMLRPMGDALLTEYLLPFELISILLLVALVGAVALVRREVK